MKMEVWDMSAIIGLVLGLATGLLGIAMKILFKLRLLPAALFILICNFVFWDWAHSIGDWYYIIVIALAAIGLGSFVVQGINKYRENQKREKAYVTQLAAKYDQAKAEGRLKDGWFQVY